MKFKVVSEKTWQPIGFGMSIVRQLAHIVDGIVCYIGYLWPLWDEKRQTFADKIMTTVCVPLNPQQLISATAALHHSSNDVRRASCALPSRSAPARRGQVIH